MSITIYISETSAPARAVLMVARLLGLPCSVRKVDSVTMRPEIKDISYQVPVLRDGDLFIADSHAIMTYLVLKYGGDRSEELYPSDLALRAIVDMRLYFNASKFSRTLDDIVKAILHEKASKLSEEQINEVYERYTALENYLEENKFLAGDHLTVADVSIVSTISVLSLLEPLDEGHEKLWAWLCMVMNEYWFIMGDGQSSILKDSMKKNRG